MSLQCWLFRSFVFLLAIIGWSVDFGSALRAVGGAPSKRLLERIASSVLTFQVVTSVRSAEHQESRRFAKRCCEKRAIGTSLVVLVSLMFGFSPTAEAGPRHGNGWVIEECPSHGLHAGQIVEFDGHRLLCDSPTACGSTCPTYLYNRASSFTTAAQFVATNTPSVAGGTSHAVGEIYEPLANVNPTGSPSNCVACGEAGSATLRGNPASALPIEATDVSALGRASRINPTLSEVNSALGKPGSQGLVQVPSANYPSHILNVVNDGGRILFVDAQAGGVIVPPPSEIFRFWAR
jgi:Papain fold toxin 1, glutamine deamidase